MATLANNTFAEEIKFRLIKIPLRILLNENNSKKKYPLTREFREEERMLNKTGRRFRFKVIPQHIFRDSKLKEHFSPSPFLPKESIHPSSKSTRRLSSLSPENFNYSARFRIPSRIRRLKSANSVPTKLPVPHPFP